jgi:hypothetical protein
MSRFVDELREELVAAAEREQFYRPRLALSSPRTLLAVVATAAVAILVVFGAATLKGPVERDAPGADPTPAVRPLFGGTLRPGVRYETRAFVPALSFVLADARWSAGDTTLPDELLLEHGEGTFDPGGERRPAGGLAFSRITEVFDPADRGPEPSPRPAPADLYSWLRTHPDLRVGPAEPVTVAGVPGERFDVEVRFDRPTYPVPMCRQRLQVACTTFTPGVFIQDGTLLQMTILQTEPDPLVITINHFTQAGLREMEQAAAPVLDSLRIGVR